MLSKEVSPGSLGTYTESRELASKENSKFNLSAWEILRSFQVAVLLAHTQQVQTEVSQFASSNTQRSGSETTDRLNRVQSCGEGEEPKNRLLPGLPLFY